MFPRLATVSLTLIVATTMVGAPPANADSYTDWTSVSAGAAHTCGVRGSGRLYCWGANDAGQLGIGGSLDEALTPQAVGSFNDWKSVSTGGAFSCGIRGFQAGFLYCWGDDDAGQLGNGAGSANVTAPQQIGSAGDWKSVSAGDQHVCAIRSSGRVSNLYCWGDDGSGQLGNGTGITGGNQDRPQAIASYLNWTSVAAGKSHTCAIRGVGRLACWGSDASGQIGNGNLAGPQVPEQIGSATDWIKVDAGYDHTCATRGGDPDKFLYCWGSDGSGRLGNGPLIVGTQRTPQRVGSFGDWKSVGAGRFHTCAIRGTGELYCWGDDSRGQVGAQAGSQTSPKKVDALSNWRGITSSDHNCALRGTGRLYCWGNNHRGQIGDGTGGSGDPEEFEPYVDHPVRV